MKNYSLLLVLLFSGLVLATGCSREEARSVQSILHSAKASYLSSDFSSVPQDQKVALDSVANNLDLVLGGQLQSSAVGDSIDKLIDVAGYTARPAMDELKKQFIALGTKSGNTPEIELLVARTFTLLTSELKSTSFRVN